ncbi:MAG: DUF2101 family protein [Methanobacteriaceae archaeon]|jgi:uncharacterized membrane protein
MKIFTKFGDLILKMFDIIGMIILEIPNIPNRLRNIDIDKIDTGSFKERISKIKNDGISKISDISMLKGKLENSIRVESVNTSKIIESSSEFKSEEKEKTVFMLQIMSGAFLVISMLFIFNFLSLTLYGFLGVASIAYILYTLYHKIKLMYAADFNAYRDFFLMYVAVGLVLVFVGTNPNFVMSFSFGFLPNLSVLIFAVIAVVAVFLIFRIKYHRNFTYGTVIETGKKTAYVKVDYDICSNIKPDVYIVDNSYGANDGDKVKLQIEEKLLSMNGNKPSSIIGILNN